MYREAFRDAEPYKIPQLPVVDLGNNENRIMDWSFLPQKVLESLDISQLTFYGDNCYQTVIDKYASYAGVDPRCVTVGVGSDHLIHMIVTTFLEKEDYFLTVNPDFFMYEVYNRMHASRFEALDLRPENGSLTLPVEALLARAEEVQAKIIMLSNPNNPASVAYSLDELERLAAGFKGILVIDEAYIEFAEVESFVGRLADVDNVLVLRTLSKAFGLAGLRVGFALGNERLIYELDKVIPPFSLSNLTAQVASQALDYQKEVAASVAAIVRQREDLLAFLRGLGDCHVLPSQASFVTFSAPWAKEFHQEASAKGWNFKYYPTGFLKGYIRLSIGRPEEMAEIQEMIKKQQEKGQ